MQQSETQEATPLGAPAATTNDRAELSEAELAAVVGGAVQKVREAA